MGPGTQGLRELLAAPLPGGPGDFLCCSGCERAHVPQAHARLDGAMVDSACGHTATDNCKPKWATVSSSLACLGGAAPVGCLVQAAVAVSSGQDGIQLGLA